MRQDCLDEGALRAYIDGELDTEDAARHLAVCQDCINRVSEIRTRAEFVSAMLCGLGNVSPVRPTDVRSRKPLRIVAGIGAGAIAAGLVILLFQGPVEPPPVVAERKARAPIELSQVRPLPPAPKKVRHHVRTVRHKPVVPPDENAIETGYIVRVALGPQEFPADLIVTPDGRIQAVRFLQ